MAVPVEMQEFINAGLGLVCASLGWFARELWNAVKELKADLAKLREELPSTYIRRDDFQDFRTELLGTLRRIEDKLDRKADRDGV